MVCTTTSIYLAKTAPCWHHKPHHHPLADMAPSRNPEEVRNHPCRAHFYQPLRWLGMTECSFGSCQTLVDSGLEAAKLRLGAATLWFTRVWQLPNLVMKSFLRWCYCVNILDTFHFALCWFCLVLFCSILSKRFDLSCVLFPYKLHTPSHQATLSIIRQKYL